MSGLIAPNPLKDTLEEAREFARRARTGFIIILVLLLALAMRYLWLQVSRHDDFTTRSESNRVHVRAVAPNRGVIYDRRGRLVAENRPAYRLELVPERVDDLEETLASLAEVVRVTPDQLERFRRNLSLHRRFDGVPLRLDLDEQEVARFSVNQHRFKGVKLVPYLSRHYPYGELLTHVLGYVGRVDERDLTEVDPDDYRATSHIGKLGVEKSYEKHLHGRSGIERVETNAQGRVLNVLERQSPEPGADLVLSLDVTVQQAAWDALGERAGSVVAIDPRDGAVIAMVSKPAYDPNAFVNGIAQADYQAILSAAYQPLFNRALAGSYEPGSTLKPFVGLAGLEIGVVNAGQKVYSNGEYYLPNYDRPYRDWKSGGHGLVTLERALEESVNTYFYHIAYELGIDRMHDYLAQFGFGQRTGLDLPGEGAGLLPSRDWKRGRFNEPWYPGETVIAGIGQGFNVTTPLQLANALAVLVNDGRRVAPRLVYALKRPGNEQAQRLVAPRLADVPVIDPDHWALIREGMRRVVNGARGTARDVALQAPYEIAGKTGTSQVATLNQDRDYDESEIDEALRDHSLFIAFAPFAAPSIVVAVVVDHGGAGSRGAAPVARATLDAWLTQEVAQ